MGGSDLRGEAQFRKFWELDFLQHLVFFAQGPQNQTFNSGRLVVDTAFADVNYKYFDSEVWIKFGAVNALRLRTDNILKHYTIF